MAQTGDGPLQNYRRERRRLTEAADDGTLTDEEADLILEFLNALDEAKYATQAPAIGTKAYSTLGAYAQNMRLLAADADTSLSALTAGELNDLFSAMAERLSNNTVQQRQSSARVFYRYHEQLDVDPDAIYIVKNEPSPVDPRDLFTRAEIDAMHAAIDNPRDRAIVDMALYTGQRIRALQTLRVKDVDIEEGRFYLNPDAFGLKGAKGMRSLLIAKGAAAEWMDYHPAPDDPDAYFITKLPDAPRGDPTEPLYQSTINRRIAAIAKKAGIERAEERGHAHNLRHTFVRWAYVHREMDLAVIKWMMGHAKDSRTLEETYFNILDIDQAKRAEKAAGVRTEDEEDITPEKCHVCDFAPIPDGSLFCPRCSTELTPDAAEERQSFQEEAEDAISEAQSDFEKRILKGVLADLRKNPERYPGKK